MSEPIIFTIDSMMKIDGGGVSFSLLSRDYKGCQCVMQNTTGTLSPGAHPGSYNGQDAYNDMLITEYGVFNSANRRIQTIRAEQHSRPTGLQECDRPNNRGGHKEDMKTVVRRLTPLECERLQGFPDGWTDIGEWTDTRGKKHKEADSPRYKALGNSICLPYWEWLARRIAAQYERPMTIGSLFDGIGGFPLAFSKAGAIPVWASEIEEFPIAVTKIHFGEE